MRNRRLVFSACLCLCLAVLPARAAEPLLWKVEDGHSGGQVYLFGALHFGAESFYPLPEAVLSAYRKSPILAVELDIETLPEGTSQHLVERLGQYRDSRQLSETLAPALWDSLSHRAEVLGLNPEQLLRLKPWLAALQLVNLQVAQSDYQHKLGLDNHFLLMARADPDKDIHQLETLEQQLALFAGLSERQQADFLEHTLKTFDTGKAQLKSLAEAWQEGDAEALEEAILGAFNHREYSQRLYHRVFRRRNLAMAETAVGYLGRGEQVFLVVGVGHLLGEEGLVALLEARGYRVSRL